MYDSISDPSQRWKLEDGTLKNKASLWQSNATWTFEKSNGTMIMIKNNNANKFLGAQSDGRAVQQDLKDNKVGQLWILGEADTDGYTTLENSKSQNLMLTATSKDKKLQVKSKYISFYLRCHP